MSNATLQVPFHWWQPALAGVPFPPLLHSFAFLLELINIIFWRRRSKENVLCVIIIYIIQSLRHYSKSSSLFLMSLILRERNRILVNLHLIWKSCHAFLKELGIDTTIQITVFSICSVSWRKVCMWNPQLSSSLWHMPNFEQRIKLGYQNQVKQTLMWLRWC